MLAESGRAESGGAERSDRMHARSIAAMGPTKDFFSCRGLAGDASEKTDEASEPVGEGLKGPPLESSESNKRGDSDAEGQRFNSLSAKSAAAPTGRAVQEDALAVARGDLDRLVAYVSAASPPIWLKVE